MNSEGHLENAMMKRAANIVMNENRMEKDEIKMRIIFFTRYLWIIIDEIRLVIEKNRRKISFNTTMCNMEMMEFLLKD